MAPALRERAAGAYGVRPVTLRHDLHALSKFYPPAMKRKWSTTNPVALIEIPSDGDAIRDKVLSVAEEKIYFNAATGDLFDLGRWGEAPVAERTGGIVVAVLIAPLLQPAQ